MRTSGVLMPISSLPSPYGIGTMGKSARKFVDFLVKGGQTYWQILPICPTSYRDLHSFPTRRSSDLSVVFQFCGKSLFY